MTQEQFIAEIDVPDDNRDPEVYETAFRRVRERLRGLDDRCRFDILFPIAVKAQWDAPSCPAAQLLREFSPACPISCEDAIRAMLPSWDVSLEEVPFYLAVRFGAIRVRQAVRVIDSETTNDSHKSRLETVSYWLGAYDECYPQEGS